MYTLLSGLQELNVMWMIMNQIRRRHRFSPDQRQAYRFDIDLVT
jgi:hypothetical protein